MALRTEVEVAGQAVVRLVEAALIPGTAQGIARAARALGIPVDAIRQAHEHLKHRTFEPPFEQACRLRPVVVAPFSIEQAAQAPRKPRAARAPRPVGPFVCGIDGCAETYPTGQGRASHRIAAHGTPVPCPKGCGRMLNPRGIGAHASRCTGAAS